MQTYAEDRIAEMIQHKFDVLFSEVFWPQFCSWNTLALDGTLGVVTTDLTNILKRYQDIQSIFPENTSNPVPKLSSVTFNPFTLNGTTPRYHEALGPLDANKVSRVFQVWPKTATGNIVVRLRTKPATFSPSDTVDFDDQALILGATYDYLEDDGTNGNATQKFQKLFESRVVQLKSELDSNVVALDPYSSSTQLYDWTTR